MAGSQTGSVNAMCNFKSIGQHSLCAEGVYNSIIILNFSSSAKPASPALPLFSQEITLPRTSERKYTTIYEYMPLEQILIDNYNFFWCIPLTFRDLKLLTP